MRERQVSGQQRTGGSGTAQRLGVSPGPAAGRLTRTHKVGGLPVTEAIFDQNAWLKRIRYSGSLEPTLGTLHQLVFAHSHAIAYESLDIMLGRTPKLDLESLQHKMITSGRGGYCLEQN